MDAKEFWRRVDEVDGNGQGGLGNFRGVAGPSAVLYNISVLVAGLPRRAARPSYVWAARAWIATVSAGLGWVAVSPK